MYKGVSTWVLTHKDLKVLKCSGDECGDDTAGITMN